MFSWRFSKVMLQNRVSQSKSLYSYFLSSIFNTKKYEYIPNTEYTNTRKHEYSNTTKIYEYRIHEYTKTRIQILTNTRIHEYTNTSKPNTEYTCFREYKRIHVFVCFRCSEIRKHSENRKPKSSLPKTTKT